MHARLIEWCRDQELAKGAIVPVKVTLEEQGLVCYLADRLDDGKRSALAAILSELMALPCRVEEYPWPQDAVGRLRRIWQLYGAGFESLIDANHIGYQDGHIVVEFPNAISENLFQRWGGAARLQSLWPEAPPLRFSVAEPRNRSFNPDCHRSRHPRPCYSCRFISLA